MFIDTGYSRIPVKFINRQRIKIRYNHERPEAAKTLRIWIVWIREAF